MKRVVVTGMGIVSSIGNTIDEVLASLLAARPGISRADDYVEYGFRCQVHGAPTLDPFAVLDRRTVRFMAKGAAWNYIAMAEAIAMAGLDEKDIKNPRTGIVMGSGGPSTRAVVEAADITRTNKSPKRIGPLAVPKAMSSTASATLATAYGILGVNYSISSACATSKHCIGNAYEQIQLGKQDIVFAGGHEDLDWSMSNLFDAMGAMSSNFNDTPLTASRAYDANRDGFVIAGGAGVLVLEEYEHAKARGAKIYAEVVGYGLSGDAYHVTAPHPEGFGAYRSMEMALKKAGMTPADIDYINAHGTSTMADTIELGAVKRLFGDAMGDVSMSSTKSAIGHLLGGAGAVEAIFCILAIRDQIVPPTLNLDNPDEGTDGVDLVPHQAKKRPVRAALNNSFGFGGTNASLIVKAVD